MNYQLRQFPIRSLPKEEKEKILIDELRRVAKLLNKKTVTIFDFKKYGKVSADTIRRTFGGWNNALKIAELGQSKVSKYSKQEIINELKRVSEILGKDTFSGEEFDKISTISKSTVRKNFHSWNNALKEAGLKIKKIAKISDLELFKNLENIWNSLTRQPFYSEMIKPLSLYSAGTYENHFGSWTEACTAFIEYKMKGSTDLELKSKQEIPNKKDKTKVVKRRTRTITPRLRLQVFSKDGYTCVKCGRSPAISLRGAIKLHVDHIIPFSKGGIDNLQTLCQDCNLGKGNTDL